MTSTGGTTSSGGTTRQLHSPKMAELVAADVRRRIVVGELAVDDTLPAEPDLMSEYGVSRGILREALRILESESLIELRRGSRLGASVRAPQARVAAQYFGLLLQWRGTTLRDVVYSRAILEPGAVREITSFRKRAPLVKELSECVGRVAPAVDDFSRFGVLAWDFSKLLVQLAGNQTLTLQHEMLEEVINAHVARVEARFNESPTRGVKANTLALRAMERVIALVDAGDERVAEDYWRRHIVAVGATMQEGIDETVRIDLFG
jgi:DNA-binding FadR family transcriptional regulator